MIVRILELGQWRLPDDSFGEVNEVDDRVQAAADRGDEREFQRCVSELVDTIQRLGTPLPPQELVGSDAIVPTPGTTLEEARALLSDQGLIPD